jgi:hypothetical protein
MEMRHVVQHVVDGQNATTISVMVMHALNRETGFCAPDPTRHKSAG